MTAIVKHIVFDIGNVLIRWDSELAYLEQIPDADERRRFFDTICVPAWNIEQDRGRSWVEAEALLIGEFPEHEDNILTFRRNWELMIPEEVPGTVEILKSLLKSGNDVTMLTNFAADTFEIAREKYEFLNLGRGVTVSAKIKQIKPDAGIYLHHEKTFHLDGAHTLFIDDSQKNVDGAIAAGWQGVLFKNAATLKADLERLGIRV